MISNYTFYNEIDNTNNHLYETFVSMTLNNVEIILKHKLYLLFIPNVFDVLHEFLPILLQNEL